MWERSKQLGAASLPHTHCLERSPDLPSSPPPTRPLEILCGSESRPITDSRRALDESARPASIRNFLSKPSAPECGRAGRRNMLRRKINGGVSGPRTPWGTAELPEESSPGAFHSFDTGKEILALAAAGGTASLAGFESRDSGCSASQTGS